MSLVRSFLDLSTGHVRLTEREQMDKGLSPATLYPHPGGYGSFIFVPGNFDPDEWSSEWRSLRQVLEYAYSIRCDFVLLDCDGEHCGELPWYEDGNEEIAPSN